MPSDVSFWQDPLRSFTFCHLITVSAVYFFDEKMDQEHVHKNHDAKLLYTF